MKIMNQATRMRGIPSKLNDVDYDASHGFYSGEEPLKVFVQVSYHHHTLIR